MKDVDMPAVDREQKGRALKPDEIHSIFKAADAEFHLMLIHQVTLDSIGLGK
jgi:hypothetical protein